MTSDANDSNGGDRKQHVILCEGYDDRAFWRGWLLAFGCTDPTNRGKKKVKDAWGRSVARGKFLFRTPSGSNVIVQPYDGRDNAGRAADETLGGHEPFWPTRVILNMDSDAEAGETGEAANSAQDQIRNIAKNLGGSAKSSGVFIVGESTLYGLPWQTDDPPSSPGVPEKQALERLAASAIAAAYPDRAPVVDDWLAKEPQGPASAKCHTLSFQAKWHPTAGEYFFEHLWEDDAIRRELETRLRAAGAWPVVEDLVAD